MHMTSMVNRGWLAALAASALALVTAVLLSSGIASANPASLSLSANPNPVEPGGQTVVSVNVSPASGETVGGVELGVTYDEAVLEVASCTPAALCNPALAPGVVGIALFDAGGLSGAVATVTFNDVSNAEGSTQVGLVVNDCKDAIGADLTCTATGVTITIAEPEEETATPTAAASPTATPGGLPATGGNIAGDSTSMSVMYLLALTGLVVVAGGAWAVARARREI